MHEDTTRQAQRSGPVAGDALRPLVSLNQQTAMPNSEFVCPGCGRPLMITLCSTMCFAEAQVYCEDCERDYQERRGQWATPDR